MLLLEMPGEEMMTGDPAAFLTAQLDKLEATAHEVLPRRGWSAGQALAMPDALTSDDERIWVLDDDYKHNTLVVDVRFVLDLVAAHRKILELHKANSFGECFLCGWSDGYEHVNNETWPCDTIKLLAQGYGWAPEETT